MKKTFLMIISVLIILAFLLSACAPAAKPAANEGAVSVTLWHAYQTGSKEEETINELVKRAVAANPDWKIDVLQIPFDQIFNKYQTEVSAGSGPDMFVAPNDDLGNWSRGGLVAPLDDLLAGKLTNVAQVAIDGMKVDGVLYGVPESAKAVALYYNKSLVPTPPKTTDELLAMVKDGTSLNLFRSLWRQVDG
jgi:arabinogalactan oligomer/maltooligosaccharide transport system substrate-binding protein